MTGKIPVMAADLEMGLWKEYIAEHLGTGIAVMLRPDLCCCKSYICGDSEDCGIVHTT